jgi:hypothetical protein
MELLGPLPARFQSYISFAAAIGAKSQARDAAHAFISCVVPAPAAQTWAAKGIER